MAPAWSSPRYFLVATAFLMLFMVYASKESVGALAIFDEKVLRKSAKKKCWEFLTINVQTIANFSIVGFEVMILEVMIQNRLGVFPYIFFWRVFPYIFFWRFFLQFHHCLAERRFLDLPSVRELGLGERLGDAKFILALCLMGRSPGIRPRFYSLEIIFVKKPKRFVRATSQGSYTFDHSIQTRRGIQPLEILLQLVIVILRHQYRWFLNIFQSMDILQVSCIFC